MLKSTWAWHPELDWISSNKRNSGQIRHRFRRRPRCRPRRRHLIFIVESRFHRWRNTIGAVDFDPPKLKIRLAHENVRIDGRLVAEFDGRIRARAILRQV